MLHFLSFCQLPPLSLNICLWTVLPKPWSFWASQHPPHPQASKGWFWPWVCLQTSSVWQLKHMGNMGLRFKVLLAWTEWRSFFFIWIQAPWVRRWAIVLLAQTGKFEDSVSDPTLSPSNLAKWFMCHCLPLFSFSQICSLASFDFPQSLAIVMGCSSTHDLWFSFSTERWGLTGNEEGLRYSLLLLSAIWSMFSSHSALPLSPPFPQALPWKSTPMEWLSGSWNNSQAFTYKLRVPWTPFTLCDGY